MMAIMELMRVMNSPAFKRPASDSRVATHTITASARAARNCTVADAVARVVSTFIFNRSIRLANDWNRPISSSCVPWIFTSCCAPNDCSAACAICPMPSWMPRLMRR